MHNLIICLWCLRVASIDSGGFRSDRLGCIRYNFCRLFNTAEKGVKVVCASLCCAILLKRKLLGCVGSTVLGSFFPIAIANFSVGIDSASGWTGRVRLCVPVLTVRLEWNFWLKATSFVIIFFDLIKRMLFRVVEADAVIIMPLFIADKLRVFILVSRLVALAVKAAAITVIA